MEDSELAAPTSTPPNPWARAGFSLLTLIAVYIAPFTYFLSACTSSIDFTQRFEWMAIMLVLTPVMAPGFAALAAGVIFAVVFVSLGSKNGLRIRNVVIPIVISAIALGALVYGAIVPSQCSII